MPIKTSSYIYDHPTIDASHTREFRHSGYQATFETVILGIPEDKRLLDDKKVGAKIIKEKLEDFYYDIHRPTATDSVLFLPSEYTPEGILQASSELAEGKTSVSYTKAGKFLQDHTGLLILSVSDAYYYRPAKSWAVQCWLIDTDVCRDYSIDYYLHQERDDEKEETDKNCEEPDEDFEGKDDRKDKSVLSPHLKKQKIILDQDGRGWDDKGNQFLYGNPGDEVIVTSYDRDDEFNLEFDKVFKQLQDLHKKSSPE